MIKERNFFSKVFSPPLSHLNDIEIAFIIRNKYSFKKKVLLFTSQNYFLLKLVQYRLEAWLTGKKINTYFIKVKTAGNTYVWTLKKSFCLCSLTFF